jgi:hypothetical protein
MIEQYLIGAIAQSLERVRQLSQIVQGQYRREYDGLRQLCLTRLDGARSELQRLSRESVVDTKLQTPRRVREFKRIVDQLAAIESVGVFALSRAGPDDDFLNCLITDVCREIAYPLIPPTISQMSQDYFHIYPEFNLLCLPLIEGRFLLHLPDIYHELCHPFQRPQNADLPKLESYHAAYKHSLFATVEYFGEEILAAERVRKPQGKLFQLQLWRNCWIKYWTEEFFCDLFGVLAAGPAFVWSHYHLCVERGGDPFEAPMMLSSTHPADDARMRAMLKMLQAMGFESQAKAIEATWKDFVGTMGFRPIPEYSQCYAEAILSKIVAAAKTGVEGIGIKLATPQSMTPFVTLLNNAWDQFWRDPQRYASWEAKTLSTLRNHTARR